MQCLLFSLQIRRVEHIVWYILKYKYVYCKRKYKLVAYILINTALHCLPWINRLMISVITDVTLKENRFQKKSKVF